MEKREDALRQALDKNAIETERWQAFKADNESTIKNLDTFVKQLTVDVMVPIGKKALMAGQLIHTNELLVGHYEGYFSTCSAHKAKEICRHRLRLAETHLKELETEADLWQNKLEAPMREGAVPNSNEIEIIEEYDEESHNSWLEEHKRSVRKQKEKERALREAESDVNDDVLKKLEEREMLEELGLDPDNINQDMLDKILSNETDANSAPTSATITNDSESEIWARLEAQELEEITEISSDAEESLKSTDELVRKLMAGEMESPSAKKRQGRGENVQSLEPETDAKGAVEPDETNDEDVDLPEEVQTIRAQMALLPKEEREEFLRSQLHLLKAKMRKVQSVHFICDELTHLMNVVVALEDDLQEMMFQNEMEASSEDNITEDEAAVTISEIETQKRRISFAPIEEKLEFSKEDTVAEMLNKSKQPQHREVITLDMPETSKSENTNINSHIMQKVEKNIELVQEQQSMQDFDLVNQILEGMTGRINTLYIDFKHSDAIPAKRDVSITEMQKIPGTPADFYHIYEAGKARAQNTFPIFVNGFAGEDEVKVSILGEAARETAYEDPRAQMSKSILRNKHAVESEPHMTNENQKKKSKKGKKKKERTLDDELRDMSAYKKVMSDDLVEKEPEEKFVDTHAPRKRISRFKEQRAAAK